ncbi:MAG: nicotinate phosphoribosyltransferase [Coriobacteriales bacterium]|nr:nicotinate phosphoribosyltransferase [Coriobacteriales bacterium]
MGYTDGLLTDLYQLTMAQAYHAAGIAELDASFHLFFRSNPFGGGFSLAAGLEQAVDYLGRLEFSEDDRAYLAGLTGNDGAPLFRPEFLEELGSMELALDVDGIAEGTPVFPGEPLLRVTGPIWQCQIVETALLNAINFQTLIATKAARVCLAAQGDPVIEFGLRRAQGPDGGMSASRAAYIGGCTGTSNVKAAAVFGIPAVGTHAHSWVMAFDTEAESFDAYAEALPNNVVLLVDTYDTLEGVRRAVATGLRLRERGHELLGVRVDSGDLAWLSKHARRILDAGGFPNARIVASNELDEELITSLKDQGAAIDMWGVGTKLVTGWGQPALGGVYKLSAIRRPGGPWEPRIKVSEQTSKVTTPGLLGVRRYRREGRIDGDMIYDTQRPPEGDALMVDPADLTRRKVLPATEPYEELLQPVLRAGARVGDHPALAEIRSRALEEVGALDSSFTRFLNPHRYPVGLERSVADLRTHLVLSARGIPHVETVPKSKGE